MPELPEVETVKNGLKTKVLNKKITNCKVLYEGIIAYPDKENFIKEITNQTINNIPYKSSNSVFLSLVIKKGVRTSSLNHRKTGSGKTLVEMKSNKKTHAIS